MNATLNTKTKRLVAALGAAAAAATPALLFAGAGIAHADDCYGALQYSYYCSPASGSGGYSSSPPVQYTPAQPPFGYNNLPGCSGGGLAGITGALSGEGC
ncbi:Mycobacterium rhizamassiliense ORFan [Mycobacterium rhizamassiliense]|jgi:hypothetical protein|uniref:Mycobacterium rhizamassiliense ORFan n=1 Tax=Mycobacterium rhizamassiliense TaxID=1841860 RepID=A0A2U3P259_9MYCO|nr:Mycobacterium rhizamassiliense ORFan [Mycobacterium rhizamassiliense]